MNCPICAARATTPFLSLNQYTIVQCGHCSFLFVDPPPSPAQLQAFYQHDQYYAGSELGYGDYLGERQQHEALARKRLERIERSVPARGTILDIGCAAGFFLHVAQERGWQTWGVELSEHMAEYAARWLKRPIVARIDELAMAPGSFDAVTMWEFIEHVGEPRAELERAVKMLRPGGVLALSTPNTGYWTAIHKPLHWREFKPPAHLGFFTEATLRRLLADCGLRDIRVRRVVARAPEQPYVLRRLLQAVRERLGSNRNRRTRLWWLFGIAWRLVERGSQLGYLVRWPGSDIHIGLEVYARKT